jgi:hypothetical protein
MLILLDIHKIYHKLKSRFRIIHKFSTYTVQLPPPVLAACGEVLPPVSDMVFSRRSPAVCDAWRRLTSETVCTLFLVQTDGAVEMGCPVLACQSLVDRKRLIVMGRLYR